MEEKNEKLKKDNNELYPKLIKNNSKMSNYLIKKPDRTKEFKNRIFILENIIVKKNNVIENLKKNIHLYKNQKILILIMKKNLEKFILQIQMRIY